MLIIRIAIALINMSKAYTLSGKKALVTGGKRRIGRGIALALAEAGCDVGINDLTVDSDAQETVQLIQKLNRKSEFYPADISDPTHVEKMFSTFLEEFGQIDILVNNPYGGTAQGFLELTEKNWDLNLDIGLKGFYLCSQQATRAMVATGTKGCIVSTSSVHGRRAWKGDTAYGVAKAGVLRLTESMAVDLGEYGIRCNAVLPGHMNTNHEFDTPPPSVGSIEESLFEHVPLRRRGTPEDIGRAVVFLCSDASACITGVSLPVDGGLLAGAVG